MGNTTIPDAVALPCGAMIHLDHIQMESGSEAAGAARYCLHIHNQKNDFFTPYPSHERDEEAVLDAVRRFDNA